MTIDGADSLRAALSLGADALAKMHQVAAGI
jgi:hypothetical protein